MTKIDTKNPNYQFVETLMHSAFPSDERREDDKQRYNVDYNDKMQCLLIQDGDVNVGFITLWSLSGISYVEHFAIADSLRQRGYGTKSLAQLTSSSSFSSSLILEVELPSTEEAIKRIAFYEKCGFKLSSRPYIQPPYSPDKQSVAMALMTYGDVGDDEIETAVGEMYRYVYGL
ncbi:MAG: GNAT family N-acetyltransferase [Paludibacteraceae bacterium]|nr:GNAT family N-acetyltransferase [Paludibacteraceae bacterium]